MGRGGIAPENATSQAAAGPAGGIKLTAARRRAAGGTGSAEDFVPESSSLAETRAAAAECRGCRLYANATQTVFGEGPKRASVMLIGEQPGDQEDKQGHPFVGPAGRLLDESLESAGIDRTDVYVTNAVKHFKWEPRGAKSARRIHKKPNDAEIAACFPWLRREIEIVKPRVIVCMGATAARSMLGSDFRVTRQRGVPVDSEWDATIIATVHPSSILRARTDEERREARAAFVKDLELVRKTIQQR